jgi:serine/threonine protein kinase
MTDTQFTFLKAPSPRVPTRIRLSLGAVPLPYTQTPRTLVPGSCAPAPTRPHASGPPRGDPTAFGQASRPSNAPFDGIANTNIMGEWAGGKHRPAIARNPLGEGQQLHKYRIVRVVGEGGFALTYEAVEPTLGRTVAIKELFMSQLAVRDGGEEVRLINGQEDAAVYEWVKFFFSREAQITFGLRHEGIVRMFEFFRKNNTAYIVYEYLQAETLTDWCGARQHKLNQAELMRFIDQTSRALAYIHRSNVLHRDIKPENIMMEHTGAHPILIDFGAAVELGEEDRSGIPIVTSGFSPPEQYKPGQVQDERTDIYAYCATLYWMLSGRRPQSAPSRLENDQLAPIQARLEPPFAHSERLCSAIMRGLSLDPHDRPVNVTAFLDDVFPQMVLANTGYEPRPKGEKIFVSYRRDDSAHFAGRLLDFLELRFGTGSVFFDVETIPIGVDFWDHIKGFLAECAAMVVVMGPTWLEELKAKRRRWYQLKAPDDFVAMEIAAAAQLRLPIIPVLFDGAAMPRARDLPRELAFLPSVNASLISDGKAFRAGADVICDQLAKLRTAFRSETALLSR